MQNDVFWNPTLTLKTYACSKMHSLISWLTTKLLLSQIVGSYATRLPKPENLTNVGARMEPGPTSDDKRNKAGLFVLSLAQW